jgi:hypothetical protein
VATPGISPENSRRNSIMWTPAATQSAHLRPVAFDVPVRLIPETALERAAAFGQTPPRPQANMLSPAASLAVSFWADAAAQAFKRAAVLDERDRTPSGLQDGSGGGGGGGGGGNDGGSGAGGGEQQQAGGLRYRNSFLPPGGAMGGVVALRGGGGGRFGGVHMVGAANATGAAGAGAGAGAAARTTRNFAPKEAKGFLDYAG